MEGGRERETGRGREGERMEGGMEGERVVVVGREGGWREGWMEGGRNRGM